MQERIARRPEGRPVCHLFTTGPGGLYLFTPDGSYLGSIERDAPIQDVFLLAALLLESLGV
jgi:hypothetical protein